MANLYVSYNGLVMGPLDDPSGLCGGGACDIPTPFVSRSDRYEYNAGKSHRVVDITINGKVYHETDYSILDTRRNAILNAFDEDFHTLVAGNYTFKYVKVNEVTFDSGNVGVVDFNISLTCYDEWFSNAGITDPKNEFSYSEGEDGSLTFRHSISARTFRADNTWDPATEGDADGDIDENDPVAFARAWCISQTCANVGGGCTGTFPSSPGLRPGWAAFSGDPFSISHTYNRAEGTYSIEETWRQGKYSTSGYVEHYDISEKYNTNDEYATIQINYSIKGPPGTSDATLRSLVPNTHTGAGSFYSKISNYPYGAVSGDTLAAGTIDPEPVSYEVKENKNEASISVTVAFNQLNPNVAGERISYTATRGDVSSTVQNWYWHAATNGYAFLEWDVSVSEDLITEVSTVDISAVLKSKGSLSVRKARVNDYLAWMGNVETFLFALAHREYNMLSGGVRVFPQSANFLLSPFPDSFSIDRNGNGEITISASFNNKDLYSETHPDIGTALGRLGNAPRPTAGNHFEWKDFTFDISQKCAMNVLSMKAGQNGNSLFPDYLIFDHNTLSRETTTISARGVVEEAQAGLLNYGNGGVSVADIAMGLAIDRAQANFIQQPLDGVLDYRALENNDVSKSRKGVFSLNSEAGSFLSKSVSVSQTVDSPFVTQDGIAAPLGTGIRP